MNNKLAAEGFGTFILVLVIQLSLAGSISFISTPVAAATVLGLFVYTIGSLSGCHLNPAVTIGLWSVKKMKTKESGFYILSQLIGGGLAAAFLAIMKGGAIYFELAPISWSVFIAEVVGAIIFGFGIAAVVYSKVRDDMSGIVIGASLLIGITVAAGLGSGGILNPAVALSLNGISIGTYGPILGSIIGAVLGMNFYKRFVA